jgi:hypothetical protein
LCTEREDGDGGGGDDMHRMAPRAGCTATAPNEASTRARPQEEFEKLDIELANLELKKRPKVLSVD